MGETLVEIRNLTKRFGPITAVDNVSFGVARGEVLGFLGPNGAGKSTTMKMITGFLAPTAGTAVVCGHDVTEQPIEVKKRLGYLPEGAPAWPDMNPASFLNFVADVRGLDGAEKRSKIEEAIERTHLEGVLYQQIDTLSKGFKRRVGLAQAILHDPEVLVLDEPTDGLDPNQKHEVRGLIRQMAKDKCIILSTHILEEVDACCTRAIIIAEGKIVADGTPDELEARSRYHNAVVIRLGAKQGDAARKELAGLAHVREVEDLPSPNGTRGFRLIPRDKESIVAEVSQHARSKNWEIEELHVESGRLDQVFRDITTRAAGVEGKKKKKKESKEGAK